MNDITSVGRSELLATIARLEERNAALQSSMAHAARDYSQMLATLTDAQAAGTRYRDHAITLKARLVEEQARHDRIIDDVHTTLSAKHGEAVVEAAKCVASAASIDGRYHADIQALREVLGAKEGECTVDAANRVMVERHHARGVVTEVRDTLGATGRESAQDAARRSVQELDAALAAYSDARDELGALSHEQITEAANRVVSERNAAVAGLAAAQVEISKLAREVEAARLNLSAHRMTLHEIRDLTGSVRVVPAEHLDEIDPRGGVKGGVE